MKAIIGLCCIIFWGVLGLGDLITDASSISSFWHVCCASERSCSGSNTLVFYGYFCLRFFAGYIDRHVKHYKTNMPISIYGLQLIGSDSHLYVTMTTTIEKVSTVKVFFRTWKHESPSDGSRGYGSSSKCSWKINYEVTYIKITPYNRGKVIRNAVKEECPNCLIWYQLLCIWH